MLVVRRVDPVLAPYRLGLSVAEMLADIEQAGFEVIEHVGQLRLVDRRAWLANGRTYRGRPDAWHGLTNWHSESPTRWPEQHRYAVCKLWLWMRERVVASELAASGGLAGLDVLP